jgi:Xaa-Pro dipeptidase
MNANPYPSRLEKLREVLQVHQLDGLALNPGPDFKYLTGLNFHLMERPVVLLVPSSGTPALVLPELDSGKLDKLPFAVTDWQYSEDRSSWPVAFKAALQAAELEQANLGMIPRRLRVLELRYLEQAGPEVKFLPAQEALASLRMIKDPEEVAAMEEAVRIAQCALSTTLSVFEAGVTEKEIASKLVQWLLHHGSEPELPFFPIVSFGPNSANPHASPSDRPLTEGDLVLIDWGASVNGYCSDITRTFAFGDLNPELEKIGEFVHLANRAGREAVQPQVPARRIDQAAREVIISAGYREYFTHRTGHGLGLEAHEEPYLAADQETLLLPGMTFTVEPGIYLPGRGGVRIEDDLLVTEQGVRSLSTLPREVLRLDAEDPFGVERC